MAEQAALDACRAIDSSRAPSAPGALIDVVVAFSMKPGEVSEVPLQLPAAATVAMALQAAQLPDLKGACGIWGKVCAPDTALQACDRVEWYRPLTVDPKVARRERFVSQGARGAGLFAKRRANSKAGY